MVIAIDIYIFVFSKVLPTFAFECVYVFVCVHNLFNKLKGSNTMHNLLDKLKG